MLKEIRCELFKEKVIYFHEGLNVVLGDNEATNSIGKSTLLLIVDFVFGGTTYASEQSDAIKVLNHHEFKFSFYFGENIFYYKRNTEEPDVIRVCNDSYSEYDTITSNEYTAELKRYYSLDSEGISFRSIVSHYSRIWGKQNHDVRRPLHYFHNQRNVETIDDLIKLFDKNSEIHNLSGKIKATNSANVALKNAFKEDYLPKITKTTFYKNSKRLVELEEKIASIKSEMYKYAISINEVVDEELLSQKKEKNELLKIRSSILNKLQRINSNLEIGKSSKNKAMGKLFEFFPNVNKDKLIKIDDFHNGIVTILKKELKESKKDLEFRLDEINLNISLIDKEFERSISNIDNPQYLIDKVVDMSIEIETLQNENRYYDEASKVKSELKELKTQLSEVKRRILQEIEVDINTRLKEINAEIYGNERKAPFIELSENNYFFHFNDDSGTGKAYSNLILFDLSLFDITILPILIHDSLLFKNVENVALSNIIEKYNTFEKQIFISIDEIIKYSQKAQKILEDKKVIQLSNSNLLFGTDWR